MGRAETHPQNEATISAAVMNAEGKVLMECVLETKGATILDFIQGLPVGWRQ